MIGVLGWTDIYVIQTDGSIYNIRISLYIYMTQRDRPYMKLMDGPVIDKTESPELYCPILDTEGVPCLYYNWIILYKTQQLD